MCPEAASPKKGPQKNIGIKREKERKMLIKSVETRGKRAEGRALKRTWGKFLIFFEFNFIKLFGGKIKVCWLCGRWLTGVAGRRSRLIARVIFNEKPTKSRAWLHISRIKGLGPQFHRTRFNKRDIWGRSWWSKVENQYKVSRRPLIPSVGGRGTLAGS